MSLEFASDMYLIPMLRIITSVTIQARLGVGVKERQVIECVLCNGTAIHIKIYRASGGGKEQKGWVDTTKG